MRNGVKRLIILSIILAFSTPNFTYAKDNKNVDKFSKSSILIDQDTGRVLYEKDPDTKRPLASLSKMMTFLLAIEAIESGVNALRINPGNIGGIDKVKSVVKVAKEYHIPIRIGVNSGSVEPHLIQKYNGVTPEGMLESALSHAKILEDLNFDQIVLSIKASSVPMTIAAYRLAASKSRYPLHLGITEAGRVYRGTIKSAVGMGCLLAEGIGDTLRVSLTGNVVEEVKSGIEILKSLGLKTRGVDFVSCPTCGRCQINLIEIADKIETAIENIKKPLKIAVMGCAVNGPGEAKDADIGIAGGINEALLFKKGQIIRKIPQDKIVSELLDEISKM